MPFDEFSFVTLITNRFNFREFKEKFSPSVMKELSLLELEKYAILSKTEITDVITRDKVAEYIDNLILEKEESDPSQKRSIEYLSFRGDFELVKQKVDEIESTGQTLDKNSLTLLYASASGNLELVEYLAGKGLNLEMRNLTRITPLSLAAKLGHLEVVKYLAALGADLLGVNHGGDTPLHEASYSGHINVVKYLVEECRVNINPKSNENNTPLHYASCENHLELVKYLVEHGADVNAKNNARNTPWHEAAHFGHLNVVKCLVEECGADVNAKNNARNTPVEKASNTNPSNSLSTSSLVTIFKSISERKSSSIKSNVLEYLKANKDFVVFRKMEYFSVERNAPVPVDLLKKALSNEHYKKEIKAHKEEFKKFLESHGNEQILDKNSSAKFVGIMSDEFISNGIELSEPLCRLVLKSSINGKFDSLSQIQYYKAISYLINTYGYEWLVDNGFEGGREKLGLIIGVNKYFESNNKALPYSIEVIDNIRLKLSKAIDDRKKISLDNNVKGVILSILGNIPGDLRSEIDLKIITRLEAEREFEGLVEEVERLNLEIGKEIKLYNNFVNKAGSKVGAKAGSKVGSKAGSKSVARGEEANSGESPKEVFQKNIANKLNELLLDLIKLSNIGETKIVKEAIDWIGLNVIKGELKQFTETKFREEARDAKSKFSTALNNLVKYVEGRYEGESSLEDLKQNSKEMLDLFCMSCAKLRMVLKDDAHNKDIESFVSRVTRCEESIEGELEGIFEYFAVVKQNLSSIYVYSDSDLLLAEVEERYEIGGGAGYGSGASVIGDGESIGLGTYLGNMSVAGSIAGSMVGVDSGDRDARGDEDSKNEELDQIYHNDEEAEEIQLSAKLGTVLRKLKDPTSRGNFSKQDMEILKSGFSGQVVQEKTASGFKIKVYSDGNIVGIASTHNMHGAKASGFNGDYNIKFLKELSDLLEEASIYLKAGIEVECPTSGGATGYASELLASQEASTEEIIKAAIGASSFGGGTDPASHAGLAAGGPSMDITGHSSDSTSMSDLD